jgi:hypothetical protein
MNSNLSNLKIFPIGKSSTPPLMKVQETSNQTPINAHERNDSHIAVDLRARIDLQRIGKFAGATFMVFNLLFAWVYHSRSDFTETYRQNPPRINRSAEPEDDCRCVKVIPKPRPKSKAPKTPKNRKKRCF